MALDKVACRISERRAGIYHSLCSHCSSVSDVREPLWARPHALSRSLKAAVTARSEFAALAEPSSAHPLPRKQNRITGGISRRRALIFRVSFPTALCVRDHDRQSGNMRRHGSYAERSILDSYIPPFVDARSRLWPSRRKDRDARCACVQSVPSPGHPPRHGWAGGIIKQQRFRLQLFQVQPLHPEYASLFPIWF